MTAMPSEPPVAVDPAAYRRHDAHLFRGWVIDKFAQLEHALAPLLNDAANRPEYAALKPKFPYLAGQKFERLRKIAEINASIGLNSARVLELLDRFKTFETLRGFLAHGTVETARTDAGRDIYIFRLVRYGADGPAYDQLVLTTEEAEAQRKSLRSTIDALIRLLKRKSIST